MLKHKRLEKDKKISVVVPMYKVERYLHRCIDSILKQTYSDFELILVNDGSPDKCGQIAEAYSKKDNRITVIHKQNGGLSSARNAGIDAAKGEYIVFIDSDDKISKDYLLKLYSTATMSNCDAVVCGYQESPTNKLVVPNFKLNEPMSGKDLVLSSNNVHSKNDLCFTWRYLFKLDVIRQKELRFNEEVLVAEDTIFNLEVLLESYRVIAIPDALYYYTVNNPESIMKTPYKPNLESSLILQYKIRKKLSVEFGLLNDNQYKTDMANYYIQSILRLMTKNLRKSPEVDKKAGLVRLLNYEMFSDSFSTIGFSFKCNNVKEYVYYLALKFKFLTLLKREFI